jgi:hypothetical protein
LLDLPNYAGVSPVTTFQRLWRFQQNSNGETAQKKNVDPGRALMQKLLKRSCQEGVSVQALEPILQCIDVNEPIDPSSGQTLLHVCAQKNRTDLLHYLIGKCGGDPTKVCKKGRTVNDYALLRSGQQKAGLSENEHAHSNCPLK